MHDFRSLAKLLEERGELYRISRPVDPRFEMPAVMEQIEQQRRAFIFENVKGATFPVIGGVLNRMECYGWALGSKPGEPFTAQDLDVRFEKAKGAGIPPRDVPTGPVKEIVRKDRDIDLSQIPVPTCFELDSGAFITSACGISRNPKTGKLNVGIYRTLILGRNIVAINASSLSDLRTFYQHAEKHGETMPIALVIGGEPALLMAASCKLPADQSELDLAGALQGKAIDLVKCETSDLRVPANAEMIIECRVDFSRKIENTLGEFAGQYGPETAPVSEVVAITHRKDAMFYAILAGKNPEHNTLGSIATFSIQRALAGALRRQLPNIADINVYLDPKFGSMAHIVISIRKQNDAEPMALIDAAFKAAGGFFPVSHITKRIVVVDEDVNVHDLNDVEWAIWTRVAEASKFRVIPNVESWELERCAKDGRGSLRLGIDATMDMEDRDKLLRPIIPGAGKVNLADYVTKEVRCLMIDPYIAVALQTTVRHCAKRSEVERNLTHIGNMVDLVCHICSLELPVRLIALGEGCIQGFADEILHLSSAEYTATMAAEIPGTETEFLGNKARQHGVYLIAQLKEKLPEYPDRFFNTVFILDPAGKIIYRHRKNVVLFVEHSTTPHDVYDQWTKTHGDTLNAFFPVAKTEIGIIGGSVGVEGSFPESWRGFAMNGAEILYRASLPEPWVSREIWDVQNRARAVDNTAYMVAPNCGALIMPGNPPTVIGGALGGRSMIVGYKGEVLAQSSVVDDCYVSSEINIEALRHYRENARFQNWLPYLRTEIYRKIYEEPVWPKNLPAMDDAGTEKVFDESVRRLTARGAFKPKSA